MNHLKKFSILLLMTILLLSCGGGGESEEDIYDEQTVQLLNGVEIEVEFSIVSFDLISLPEGFYSFLAAGEIDTVVLVNGEGVNTDNVDNFGEEVFINHPGGDILIEVINFSSEAGSFDAQLFDLSANDTSFSNDIQTIELLNGIELAFTELFSDFTFDLISLPEGRYLLLEEGDVDTVVDTSGERNNFANSFGGEVTIFDHSGGDAFINILNINITNEVDTNRVQLFKL